MALCPDENWARPSGGMFGLGCGGMESPGHLYSCRSFDALRLLRMTLPYWEPTKVQAAEVLFVCVLVVAVGGEWLGRSACGHPSQSIQVGKHLFPAVGIFLGCNWQIRI